MFGHMFSANTSNTCLMSTNDPNYIIANTQTLRSIDEVLNAILINRQSNTKGVNGDDRRKGRDGCDGVDREANALKEDNERKGGFESQRAQCSEHMYVSYDRVFQVVYGVYKPYKKHKQFSSDGFLTLNSRSNCVHLYSIEGKSLSQSKGFKSKDQYCSGERMVMASKELEIGEEVSAQEFESGMYFIKCDE